MELLGIMLFVVFALLTAILLLVAGASRRYVEGAPWQMLIGLVGVAFALPLLIVSGDGAFLLALSAYNALVGAKDVRNARRTRRL